jgi:hypothetical protein
MLPTNTVVNFDGKDGNLYLWLRAMSHTIYAAKFEQMITHIIKLEIIIWCSSYALQTNERFISIAQSN